MLDSSAQINKKLIFFISFFLSLGILFAFIIFIEKTQNFLIKPDFAAYGETSYVNNTSLSSNSNVDSFTLLVYMIGSTLEEEAIDDITEMLKGNLTDSDVNLLVQTGGGHKGGFSTVQRHQIFNHKMFNHSIDDSYEDSEHINMADNDTLTDFIKWGISNFTAKKYGLILWDHGFGIKGFGMDVNSADDALYLAELESVKEDIRSVLNYTNLEFIGFDSCLMGTAEVADALSSPNPPLSKYLIASEEITPNWGWNYTTIVNSLSANSSLSGDVLGYNITQSYINDSKRESQDRQFHADRDITLSVIDLRKIFDIGLKEKMDSLMASVIGKVNGTANFIKLLQNIDRMEHFGQGASNDYTLVNTGIIDIFEFFKDISNLLPSLKQNIDSTLKEIRSAVIHNYSAESHPNAQGLSVYLPINIKEFDEIKRIKNYPDQPIPLHFLSKKWKDFLNEIEKYVSVEGNLAPVIKSAQNKNQINIHITRPDIQSIYANFILNSSKGKPILYTQKLEPSNITEKGYFTYNTNKMLALCDEDDCIPSSMANDNTKNLTKYFINAAIKHKNSSTPVTPTLVYELQNGEFIFLGGVNSITTKGGGTVSKEKVSIDRGDILYTQALVDHRVTNPVDVSDLSNSSYQGEAILKFQKEKSIFDKFMSLKRNMISDKYLNITDPSQVKPKMINVNNFYVQFIICDYSESCQKTRVYNINAESKAVQDNQNNLSTGNVLIKGPGGSNYIYINHDYNFELEYPVNWVSVTQDVFDDTIYLEDPIVASFYPLDEVLHNNSMPLPHVNILVQDVIDSNNLNASLYRIYNGMPGSNQTYKIGKPSNSSHHGHPALSFTFESEQGRLGYYFSTTMNKKEYHIGFEADRRMFHKYFHLVENMIKTLSPATTYDQLNQNRNNLKLTDEKERLQNTEELAKNVFSSKINWTTAYSNSSHNFNISLPVNQDTKEINEDPTLKPQYECNEDSTECTYARHAFLPKFGFVTDDANMYSHAFITIINGSKISNNTDLLQEKMLRDEFRDLSGFEFSERLFGVLKNNFNYRVSNSYLDKVLNSSLARIDELSFFSPSFDNLVKFSHLYTIIDGKFLSVSLWSRYDDVDHQPWFEKIIKSLKFS